MSRAVDILIRLSSLAGYSALAGAADVSPSTMRAVVENRRMPATRSAAQKVEALAAANEGAVTRKDIRFV